MSRALARVSAAAAILVASTLLAACAATPMPTPTPTPSETALGDGVLKIGTLFPTSGSISFLGAAQVAGVNAAVRQINAEGGVLGEKVVVVNRDSGDASSKKLEASFEALVERDVDVIIGPSTSVLALRLLPLAAEARIPVITPAATSPQITRYDVEDWIFRTIPSYDHQGVVLGSLLPTREQERVALVYIDGPFGYSLVGPLGASLAEAGGELVSSIRITAKSDEKAVVADLVELEPDAVVLATADNGTLTKKFILELKKQKLAGDRLWLTSLNLADYSQALPKGTLEGVNGILEGAPGDSAFSKLIKREDPGVRNYRYSVEAFDATVLAALAAVTAGSDAGPAIRDSLVDASVGGIKCTSFGECVSVLRTEPDADYDGLSGALNLDENGDPTRGAYGIFTYGKDGKYSRKSTEIG